MVILQTLEKQLNKKGDSMEKDILVQLYELKDKALNGEIKPNEVGICRLIDVEISKKAFESWEFYSGSKAYPVGGFSEYLSVHSKRWLGSSFKKRINLIDHLIELAESGETLGFQYQYTFGNFGSIEKITRVEI